MPQDDGMAFLGAPLPAEGAETVYAAVSAKADQDKAPDDARTKAQRRADALVGLCADYLNGGVTVGHDTTGSGPVPRYHGLRPAIHVSVALLTLLGLDEQPGELDGHGPIPASVALPRRLRLHWPGDPHCAPGCNQPAAKADLHRIRPWSQGGDTNAADLAAACQHDHYSVHEAGWQIRRLQDGTVEWTSPTGHAYRVPPATYPIDTTSQHPAEGEDQNDHGNGPATEDEPPF